MSKDMKRLTAPRSWPIKRKTNAWVTKPSPGPHAIENSMPAVVVMRDLLQLCATSTEVRQIISEKSVLVNGKVVKNGKFPIGIMDIISIPKTGTSYRMVINRRGQLTLVKVQEGREAWKLSRIENKTTITGGKIQLNLHDGTNLLVEADTYKTGDVLKIEVPSQKILETYKLAKGSVVLIMSGSHVGETAVIEEYEITRTSSDNLVRFKDGSYTIKSNVFVIGTKAPEIELPEESAI